MGPDTQDGETDPAGDVTLTTVHAWSSGSLGRSWQSLLSRAAGPGILGCGRMIRHHVLTQYVIMRLSGTVTINSSQQHTTRLGSDATHQASGRPAESARHPGAGERVDWVFGSFYGVSERRYGQSAYAKDYVAVNGPAVTDFLRAVTGIPDLVWSGSRPLAGHPDTEELFFSDLDYDFEQLAFFGEASVAVTDRLSVTGGLRWYDFDEERTQVFDGLFADPLDSTGTTSASGIGFLNGRWDIAFFVDNVTDERALLALDQERGTLARVGYLTNRPRSFGVSTRIDF